MSQLFRTDFKVRDYECDIQGIVNNSVYGNYLEHARHEFLHAMGIDFAEEAKNGIYLVVTRAELDYRQPLKSGDEFYITVRHENTGRIRGKFIQQVRSSSDDSVLLDGVIYWASINPQGRPIKCEHLIAKMDSAG